MRRCDHCGLTPRVAWKPLFPAILVLLYLQTGAPTAKAPFAWPAASHAERCKTAARTVRAVVGDQASEVTMRSGRMKQPLMADPKQ